MRENVAWKGPNSVIAGVEFDGDRAWPDKLVRAGARADVDAPSSAWGPVQMVVALRRSRQSRV